jgi:23S rRNA (uracil1939-C5)-methyltransferase
VIKNKLPLVTVVLDKIVGGGQAIATEENGRKLFVWGGLPGETVEVQLTKKKPHMAEGMVTKVIKPSPDRIEPKDKSSYLSTSPWQIMSPGVERHYKSALIEEAFELHDIVLPNPIEVYGDDNHYEYRNKIEFSWWWSKDLNQLDLAFFRRGSHSKIPIEGTSLAIPGINIVARAVRDLLRTKSQLRASDLKTLLIRSNQQGEVVAQLYVKSSDFTHITKKEYTALEKSTNLIGLEVIYSDPKSPASIITKKLQSWGQTSLNDSILGINFDYSIEGFFQINLPVYEKALQEIRRWVKPDERLVDFYSGVGTIGLTVSNGDLIMVESNKQAYSEMQNNIFKINRKEPVKAILAASEKSLEHIKGATALIVDPPRAGLHDDIIQKILLEKPKRLIYLSCNPVTQARDISKLLGVYGIRFHQGYNFFPRTPHIEHLVVLDLIKQDIIN